MPNELIIKNGTIVTPTGNISVDIHVKNGVIAALLMPGMPVPDGWQVYDAKGLYVLPGAVDGHTHPMDPGFTDREDFEHATMAAAVAGLTTIVDHHRTAPPVYSVEPLLEKINYLNTKSCVDFGLKGGISPSNTGDLEAMWEEGITGFKTFTCDLHGVKAMHTSFLMESFTEVARINGTVLIHCEDNGICAYNEEFLKANGRTDSASQWEWRSKLAERVAVKTVIEVAKETGCRTVIAHVSQPELLREIKQARDEGYEIYAETCPHYFYLTPDDLNEKGPWVKFTPPMNTDKERRELWRLFDRGYVTVIGSDHCPYPKSQKEPGEKNIWDAPNGIPGIDTSLKLMLNGANEGHTTLNRIVQCMCENPAKVYGLYPRKGHLQPGADADIVLVDMEKHQVIHNDEIISKCKWSPFDGKEIKGVPVATFLRGELIAKDGQFLGEIGYGKFVRRDRPVTRLVR